MSTLHGMLDEGARVTRRGTDKQRRSHRWSVLAAAAVLAGAGAPIVAAAPAGATVATPLTPIQHLVIIIGENHSFDNVFGTYRAPTGQSIRNLLSEGIVTATGGLGPNVAVARQAQATDTTTYSLAPTKTGPYAVLPRPNTTNTSKACTGVAPQSPDTRFPANLANGPYQITKYVPYNDNHSAYSSFGTCPEHGAYVGDPIHRFYQMWQQGNEGTNALYTWVAQTAGGDAPVTNFQGALQMGYYNMAAGDAPTLHSLATKYAMSDNFHQAAMGGTGTNHVALGEADAAYYQQSNGSPTTPPSGQIENPNPQGSTNNKYTQDGYVSGTYTNCSGPAQPGVHAIRSYLSSRSYASFHDGDCQSGAYYMVNNTLFPGYNTDGTVNSNSFAVPPQHFPTIADELSAAGVTWGYFGEGYGTGTYCGICDPFQYATSVMTDSAKRANVQHSSTDFDNDVTNNSLPAVSFLKPSSNDDGHPASSSLAAFEGFVSHAVNEIRNNATLWQNTAVLVTMDETGGYYDSGYIQPVSFFGDGPRVPLLVISRYTKAGHIDHTYNDDVSILKFIEYNWHLARLSARSWDNLPNPTNSTQGGYVPGNRPAIGSLLSLFDFSV